VPLIFRGELVGAMQMLNKRNGRFDDADVERAVSIASAVAIAVHNALLFDASQTPSSHDGSPRELLAFPKMNFAPASRERQEAVRFVENIQMAVKKLVVTGNLNHTQKTAARHLVEQTAALHRLLTHDPDRVEDIESN
jgi:hypothetical protein